MYNFFDSDIYWKSYVIENLLVTKMMYDRGFDVANWNIHSPIIANVIDMLFGESYWKPALPSKLPEKAQEIYEKIVNGEDVTCEEEEAGYYINSYISRYHYRIEIPIDDLTELKLQHYNRLMDILKKVCCPLDDITIELFAWYELIEEVDWLRKDGKITGICVHFVDVEQESEDPVSELRYNEAFITFWDTLQEIRKELVCDKHKNSARRKCVCQPERAGSDQGEASGTELPAGADTRIVA